MNNAEELIKQAKIQGFSRAVLQERYKNSEMPIKKQMFIQDTAEIVFNKMVTNNIAFDNDVIHCEYIREVLNTVLKNIPAKEKEEVFELTFYTLNEMIKFILSNNDH